MSEENHSEKKNKRVKTLTVRFNKEILPFQHMRIEASSNITKSDDADEVATELESFVEDVYDRLSKRIFGKDNKDNLPY